MAKFSVSKTVFYSLEIEAETEAEAWGKLRAMDEPPWVYDDYAEFIEEAYPD